MLVVANVIFAMLAVASVVSDRENRVIYWGVNLGAIGFVIGLIAESVVLKRIFTPILGPALLYGIYIHLRAEVATADTEPVALT